MKKRKQIIGWVGIIFSLFMVSCQSNEKGVDISKLDMAVSITRLDKTLMAVSSKEDVARFLSENEAITRSFYRAYPDDTAFVSYVYELTQHPETRALYNQTDTYFGDLKDLQKQFEEAFKRIKFYYPQFKAPAIYTTFSGLQNDLFVSDSLIVIALESFIGPEAKYRPQLPVYMLTRYQKESLVPTVIRLLSDSYVKSEIADQTLLGDMVYFGKSFEFTKTMLPDVPAHLIIDYTDSTYQKTWYAQDLVWAHLIDKGVLYEKTPRLKEVYLGERPFVVEIGPACPGRIGQWVGWRIVNEYRTQNPSLSFVEVMENKNAQDILQKSKYRGEIAD